MIQINGTNPVSDVIIAILIGIGLRSFIGVPSNLQAGIEFSMKKVLKLAIILLGLGLNISAAIATGGRALMIIIVCVIIALVLMHRIGKLLGLSEKLSVLIGVGTSICGTTAIVAVAPAIKSEDTDVAYSVATITLFGVLAIFAYPVIGALLKMSDMQFGTWAGTAINETAQVVAAGFAYSEEAGKIATVVKLTRTVLLAPLVVILGYFFARKDVSTGRERVNLKAIFPWFVLGFFAMALARTFGDNLFGTWPLWDTALAYVSISAKFLIVMAMVGVGLMSDFTKMRSVGLKPFIGGFVAALIMGVLSITLIYILQIG
ncbi:hypothetical protein SY88_12255 [Clostridiales bacterium PH28_bin88]|nr:hypothetical protein SY88_12255 [Clostridiales bacterium PH28_bin88]